MIPTAWSSPEVRRSGDWIWAAIATLVMIPAAAGQHDDPRAALARLYYKFEVAAYCGLVDNQVGEGYRRLTAAALARLDLDQPAVDRLRGKAWQAAHAEWQNRGLGGFRGWCRSEGETAASRFRDAAERPSQP